MGIYGSICPNEGSGGCHWHFVDSGSDVGCPAVIRTVHSTRDRPAWLSSHIPLDADVCENPVHNYQGPASNTILHINTKDFLQFRHTLNFSGMQNWMKEVHINGTKLRKGGTLLRVVHCSRKSYCEWQCHLQYLSGP